MATARSEWRPGRWRLGIGTPSTGSVVLAARTPARCAAPPAPAMRQASPREAASLAYWMARSGVRCAEITRASQGTPNARSRRTACCMTSQSDLLPITTPTSGSAISDLGSDGGTGAVHGPPLGQRRLGGGEPGDGDPIGRAGDVVHLLGLAEGHRARLPAVLAADPQLEVLPHAAAQRHRHRDKLADPLLVEDDEGIGKLIAMAVTL